MPTCQTEMERRFLKEESKGQLASSFGDSGRLERRTLSSVISFPQIPTHGECVVNLCSDLLHTDYLYVPQNTSEYDPAL